MPEKLYTVHMENDDIGTLLIGVATNYNNAVKMVEIAAKEFDSCSFRISSCLSNAVELGNICYQFDENGEKSEFRLEYGLWHDDAELWPEDFGYGDESEERDE